MAFGLDLGSLVINLKMDTAQFKKQAKSLGPILKNIGGRATALGASISLKVTAPIVAMGAASIFAFGQFDEAITKSTAIMTGATAELRKEMERTAIVLSDKTGTSARNLGDAYFFLASAGFTAEQSIAALSTVNSFAIAGQFDMALATDLLTDAQTALGLSSMDVVENQKQMVRISDVLVKANTIANASVQQFAQSLTADAATAARNFGADLETTVAVLAAYASAGKKGAEAGNLFGRATRLLTKAQRENGKVFEKFGIEVINKTTGQYNSLIDIIAQMEVAFKDLTKPQRDAALELLGFAALAQKSITPLLGLSDAMKDYKKSLDAAAGATEEITNKQLKAFNAQMKILFENIRNVAAEIGKILSPAVLFVSAIIKKSLELWKALPTAIKTVVIIILGLVAAIGPLIFAFGILLSGIAFIISILPALTIAFEFIGIVVAAAASLLSVAFAPIIGIILGVIAVIVLLIIFWDDLVAAFNKVAGFLKGIFMPLWDAVVDIFKTVMGIVVDLGNLILSILMPILQGLWSIIKTLLIPIFVIMKVKIFLAVLGIRILIGIFKFLLIAIEFIIGGLQKLVNFFGVLISKIGDAGSAVGDFIKDSLVGISDKIKDMTGGLIDFVKIFSVIGNFLKDIFEGIVEFIKEGVTNLQALLSLLAGGDGESAKEKKAREVEANRVKLLDKAQEKLDQRDEFRATAKLAREQGNIKVAEEAERKAEGAQQAANALFRAQTTGEFKLIDLSDPRKKKVKTPQEQLKGVEKTLKDILDKSKKEFEQSKPTIAEKTIEKKSLDTQTKFQQINLARIGIGGIGAQAVKENKGIEDRQDRTNELLEQITITGNPAVVAS